jgi:hypothetical protein
MILFLGFAYCGIARAADEFDGVQCGTGIRQSLIGKHSGKGPVRRIEAKHKDLGLKDLGGVEISDKLFEVSWRICGKQYNVLLNLRTNVIRDVIEFPTHSSTQPEFDGVCQINHQSMPDALEGVLDNRAGLNPRDSKRAKTMLPAVVAWKVDEYAERFVAVSVDNLMCPLSGVITADGGF